MYFRNLSLRQVKDQGAEPDTEVCQKPVRFRQNRFDPMFVDEIRRKRPHPRSRR